MQNLVSVGAVGPELMELNFCRFIHVMNDIGLTRRYKTEVFFTFMIYLTPHLLLVLTVPADGGMAGLS